MFSDPSFGLFSIVDGIFAFIINQWFSWMFWVCRGLWYVSSAIDIIVSLNFKIGSVHFGSFPFEVFPCISVRTGASQLCQIYTV
jgi:hypothetical protein